jgi:hypothetical protein
MNRLKHIQSALLLKKLSYLENNSVFVCNCIKFDIIFASNKTHHASHLNSAPGWVFDFYGGHVL